MKKIDKELFKRILWWVLGYSIIILLILMIAFPPQSYLEALLNGY